MNDFDNLWRGNLSYNSDRWGKIKAAKNRYQRPSVMPDKPRILKKPSTDDGRPEVIIETGKK